MCKKIYTFLQPLKLNFGFGLYESKVRPYLRPGASKRTLRQQISSHFLPGRNCSKQQKYGR